MSSSYPSIIGALKDSLSKPDLHPRARAVLERRLEHHLDRERRGERIKKSRTTWKRQA